MTRASRSAQADKLPPVAGTLPGYQVTTWVALLAPPGTPSEVVAKLNRDGVEALASAPVRTQLAGLGIDVIARSPTFLTEHMQSETRRFAKVIKDAHIKGD